MYDMVEVEMRLAEEKCSDFDFIKAGYRKWQEHALYEQRCLENDNFMRILMSGLQGVSRFAFGKHYCPEF